MVHDRPWLPVCYAFKGFKGIQRDPKGQRLNDHHPPIAGRSSEISDAANFQQTSKEGILKKKNSPLWHVGYEFVTLVRLALGTTERGMPLAERFEWTGRSATMEEAYKARLRKLAWLVTSYPESDHRIISKPKWTSSLCMRWYSTGFCEALEDFAGQTSFRNAEWNQVTESNINLEPGHI